jgi:signal transduction histidine kinase
VREFIVKREPVVMLADLRDILADVAYFIELRAREAGVTVSIVQADVPLPVRCERVLIGQVILNLAFNAIEAFAGCERATPMLTLGTAQIGALAELRAIDNGPGVADDAHDRLFDGFSSSKAGGNGIGLSLCKSIVTRHGGRIAARRAEGGGLDCRVTLPLADARA